MQVIPLDVKLARTVNVDVKGAVPVLVDVNEGTFPVPMVGPNPMGSGVLLQLNVAPGTSLVNTVAGTVTPVQCV